MPWFQPWVEYVKASVTSTKRPPGNDMRVGGQLICEPCQAYEVACVAEAFVNRKAVGFASHSTLLLHGSFNELQQCAREGCQLCRCWSQALIRECSSLASLSELRISQNAVHATTPITEELQGPGTTLDSRFGHFFELTCGANIRTSMRLCPVDALDVRKMIDRDPLSGTVLSQVQDWLRECHESHVDCTHGSTAAPKRLLDIRNDHVRLVDGLLAEGEARYIALSYCWGTDQKVKLTHATEQRMREGIDFLALAKTISDAISLCRELCVGYLWVDSLCIMQDVDTHDWENEARNMHIVYGNAYMTLSVCSASNACEGFLRERWPDDLEFDLSLMRLLALLPTPARKSLANVRTTSPLSSRGWVFQEEILSPRTLYWSDQGIFFSCQSGTRAESVRARSKVDELFPHRSEPIVFNPHEFQKTDDPLLLWDDMITSFSAREFTIESDRLPAVSGLATLIKERTHDEYLHGLWRNRLPAQLLWTVTGLPRTQGLGKDSGAEAAPSQRTVSVPSWTWASIACARTIEMPKQASAATKLMSTSLDGLHLHLRGKVRPLVEGLRQLTQWPAEEVLRSSDLRFPVAEHEGDIWAVDRAKRRILICTDWKLPILVQLDNDVPENLNDLLCLEINYRGCLLLQPCSEDGRYRRIGCAQSHQNPSFFDKAKEMGITLT